MKQTDMLTAKSTAKAPQIFPSQVEKKLTKEDLKKEERERVA